MEVTLPKVLQNLERCHGKDLREATKVTGEMPEGCDAYGTVVFTKQVQRVFACFFVPLDAALREDGVYQLDVKGNRKTFEQSTMVLVAYNYDEFHDAGELRLRPIQVLPPSRVTLTALFSEEATPERVWFNVSKRQMFKTSVVLVQ